MRDLIAAAMFITDEGTRAARLAQLAREYSARATAAEDRANVVEAQANLYGGIAAVFLDSSGAQAVGVPNEVIAEIVGRRGLLGIEADDQGITVRWVAPIEETIEADDDSRPRLRIAE